MPAKVVSVRLQPQTLADIYNFLNLACQYNVSNLPISTAVGMSLDNMMRWVRQSIDLPTYKTDEEALSAVRHFINKIPSAYIEKTDRPALLHTQPPVSKEAVDCVMSHNNKEEIRQDKGSGRPAAGAHEGMPTQEMREKAEHVIHPEDKKAHLVTLIDQFREKEEVKAADDLLGAIKTESIYKEEE